MKSKRMRKPVKIEQGLLLDVARTIGSTLGTLAAKTDLATKHIPRRVSTRRIGSKAGKSRNKRNV